MTHLFQNTAEDTKHNVFCFLLVPGFLYDWTQHYPNSFYLGGAVTIAGALALIPTAIHVRGAHTEAGEGQADMAVEDVTQREEERGSVLCG